MADQFHHRDQGRREVGEDLAEQAIHDFPIADVDAVPQHQTEAIEKATEGRTVEAVLLIFSNMLDVHLLKMAVGRDAEANIEPHEAILLIDHVAENPVILALLHRRSRLVNAVQGRSTIRKIAHHLPNHRERLPEDLHALGVVVDFTDRAGHLEEGQQARQFHIESFDAATHIGLFHQLTKNLLPHLNRLGLDRRRGEHPEKETLVNRVELSVDLYFEDFADQLLEK